MGIVKVGKPTCLEEDFSSYIASIIAGFYKFSVCLANRLGRDSTSTWLMQQKVAMMTVGKAGHFGISMFFWLNGRGYFCSPSVV